MKKINKFGQKNPLLQSLFLKWRVNPNVEWILLILFMAIPFYRFGYHFGGLDHVILSLKGISEADSSAFKNDWFVQNAPQPHWHFDLITQFGESFHFLQEIYFVYWLASIAVLVRALKEFGKILNLQYQLLAVALLILLGPWSFLGTGAMWGSWALPHFMGASLGALTLAYWLQNKTFKMYLGLALTSLVHTHHGALISMLLIGAMSFSMILLFFTEKKKESEYKTEILEKMWRSQRWQMLGAALNLLLVYLTARMRGLTEDGDVFLASCHKYIPGHCFAPVWKGERFFPLVAVGLMILGMILRLRKNKWNPWAALVVVAGSITLLGTALDYFDAEPLVSFYRRFFLHRLAAYTMLFVPLVLVDIFFHKFEREVQSGTSGNPSKLRLKVLARTKLMKILCLLGLAFYFASPSSIFVEMTELKQEAKWQPIFKEIGNQLRLLIPTGEVITMNPDFQWIRYASRRAVVVDRKAIPYQSGVFKEWEERMAHLGAFRTGGFESLTWLELKKAMKNYHSKYLILSLGDPKMKEAQKEMKFLGSQFNLHFFYWPLP